MSKEHPFTPIVILKFEGIRNEKNRSLTFQIDELGVYYIVEKNEIWSRSSMVRDTVDLIFYQITQQQSQATVFINKAHDFVDSKLYKVMSSPKEKKKLSVVIDLASKSIS